MTITPAEVEARFEEAALTLRRLPDPAGSGPRGYGSSWPDYVHDARHAYGYGEVRMRITPSAADIAGTRANMLSERGLDALRYPTVNVEVEGLQGEGGHWAAALRITLHGQQRRYWVPVRIEPEGKAWRVRLELALAQSDFGLQPFSVLGGLLAVQDVLQLRAELRFVPA